MTTEFPSGERATVEKLTVLKNSSRVSLGLESAKVSDEKQRSANDHKRRFEIFIGLRELDLYMDAFGVGNFKTKILNTGDTGAGC